MTAAMLLELRASPVDEVTAMYGYTTVPRLQGLAFVCASYMYLRI